MTANWRSLDDDAPAADVAPWQVPCRAQQYPTHMHKCATAGDIGHRWHYCRCGYSWSQVPPSCCMGTGFADHAAVPCQAPDCPVPARTPGLSDWEQRIDSAQSIGDLRALSREMETAGVLENRRLLRRRAKRAASFLFAARVRATTPENGATQ